MIYLYCLSWIAVLIQSIIITLALGAGLYYLCELVEEYAFYAKKVINYSIIVNTVLAFGLFIFEDLPYSLVTLCIVSNLFYYNAVKNFPMVQLTSASFILSIIFFLVHNYFAFDHFNATFHPFYEVISYMTVFCWVIPLGLLVSCSANDNTLPIYSSGTNAMENGAPNVFKTPKRKLNFLSLMRYIRENYLPEIGRKSY